MKKITFTTLCLFLTSLVYGQDAQTLYEQGLEKAQAGKLEEAIELFDKSIMLKPDEYVAWFNRGMAKSMLSQYEEALTDYDQTVKLNPEYKKGYLSRGIAKKRLTDYEGALADYTYAIKLDNWYGDAYYNRGLLYGLLSKPDSACIDFIAAKELGLKGAESRVKMCNDTTKTAVYPILYLKETASTAKYGFTSEDPVKVGNGPDGGPGNQKTYLNLLRDAQGKPLKYQRLGGCCPYPSPNGFMGSAMVDKYEITYKDAKGTVQKKVVYISFYDYETPKILQGFKTVGK
jgi:tetratricopeptide (TPR) repeat protein